MPRRVYEDWNPGRDALSIVRAAVSIAEQYAQQGYDLTLRQLYYQFVSRDILPNNQQSYNKLGQIVNRARLAGFLDWNYITDRTRNLKSISHWEHPSEIVATAAQSFRVDKWATQPTRIEVWVEKEALAGVIQRAADQLDCAWFSCRGYVSQSEMWGAAQRIGNYIQGGQNVVILHLGDHDPSGIDMTRDIKERLEKFIAVDISGDYERFSGDPGVFEADDYLKDYGYDHLEGRNALQIERIALNIEQVQQYSPPPNPAKITDSRAVKYIRRFGGESWELDALEPAVLENLIQSNIDLWIDDDAYQRRALLEATHRRLLDRIADDYDGIVQRLEQGQ